MKKAKSTGALIVSLVLAASMLLVGVIGMSTVGVKVYKAAKGEMELEVVTPDVEAGLPAEDVSGWTEPEAAADGDYAMDIALERVYEGGDVYGVVTGYMADGGTWEYHTTHYPVTELEAIEEIVAYDDMYIFNAGGEVIALDTRNGQALWVNADFGGQSIAYCIDENRTMYLCGYYGPDLCIIDINGNTLDKVEGFDSDYYWPYEVGKNPTDSNVKITFEQGPAGEAASIVYNTANHSFYTFDSELILASEMETWKNIFISHKLDDSMKDYDRYALVHIDNDGIPEMIGYGDDCSVVLKYMPATDDVKLTKFANENLSYYPGDGVFIVYNYVYENNVSENETCYYGFDSNGVVELGKFWIKDYQDAKGEYVYEYKLNDAVVDSSAYYDALALIEEPLSLNSFAYPRMYTSDEIDRFIMNWNDTSDDESTWKQMFIEEAGYRSNYDGFSLVDLNADGIPEMFIHNTEEYGEYGYIFVCDVQTHQFIETYTSAKNVCVADGSDGKGLVYDTQQYGSSSNDYIYAVEPYRVAQVDSGFNDNYSGKTEYYMEIERGRYDQVDRNEYAKRFPNINGNFKYLYTDCVSYDEIMAQLK